jgi:hypothetical protein
MNVLEKSRVHTLEAHRKSAPENMCSLSHPTVAIQKLYEDGSVPQQGYDTLRARQIETGDVHCESRSRAKKSKQTKPAALSSDGKKGAKVKTPVKG